MSQDRERSASGDGEVRPEGLVSHPRHERRAARRLGGFGGFGRFGVAALAGLVALVVVAGCGSPGGGSSAPGSSGAPGGGPGTTVPAGRPVAVPLGRIASAGGGEAVPTVVVQVGTSRPLTVVLDTGSVGLHVYGTSLDPVAAGLQPSGRTDTIDYADGTTESGPIYSGTFTIGGIASPAPVQLGVIQTMGCVAAVPSCPGTAGPGAFTSAGIDGTLGIGLDADDPVNPVQLLPSPYGDRWSVHLDGDGGSLVLGAPVPASPVATIALPPGPPDPDGSPTFGDRQAPVCWTVAGSAPACVPTLFDSGSASTVLAGPAFGAVPTDGSGHLTAGTPYAAAAGPEGTGTTGPPFWTATAGQGVAPLVSGQAPARANTGAGVFIAATITIDGRQGTLRVGG